MPDLNDLGQVVQELTERAIEQPASLNRPINLYAVNYETLIPTENAATLTLNSTANWAWTSVGSTVSLWAQAEFRSS